jgi:kynurenine formamidase
MANYDYALNRINAESILKALSSVKKGKIYDLGNTMSKDMPMGSRNTFDSFSLAQYRLPSCITDENAKGFDFAMDTINCCPHLGTHMDCFSHVQYDGKTFNGDRAAELLGPYGWEKYTSESVPPIIARGVLIDIAKYLGVDIVPDGFVIDEKVLEDAVKKLDVKLQQGDVVLIHTGKQLEYLNGDENYFTRQCGVVGTGATWLYNRGMILLGTDTSATDPMPMDVNNTTHAALMIERGVHVIEILDLDELAKDDVREFTFIGLPIKIKGATGAWIRPIAMV